MTNVNAGLIIDEPEGGIKFGTDALLLAHFMLPHAGRNGFELGTGSGVIPLLYLSVNKSSRITAAELQPLYADTAASNARRNGLDGRMDVICEDIRDHRAKHGSGSYDFVFTNPPYFGHGSGFHSKDPKRDKAFHEDVGGLCDFLDAAAWLLKSGGKFYVVFRPERMATLMHEMSARRITPKRLKLVFPDSGARPSLILIEGRKDGAEGLITEKNLYIYDDASHVSHSPGMNEIFETFRGE